MLETELYLPVKRFLEAQGYDVKAEIGDCDVLAVRGEEPPVIVELKTGFNLQLLLQGIDRQAVTDTVYLAIPEPKRSLPRDILRLCKRLGLGLLVVNGDWVEAYLDPAPTSPAKRRAARPCSCERVSAPRWRSQFRRQQQAPPGYGLSPGCLALREISEDHRASKVSEIVRANES